MNFRDVLLEHNIAHRTEGRDCRPGWIQFQCPFCGGGSDTTKFYAGYCIAGHFVNCWQCGPHRISDTLAELLGLPRSRVPRVLGSQGSDEPKERRRARVVGLPKGISELGRPHRAYLRERGFEPEQLIKLWGIRGIGVHAHLSWRLFIPIHFQGAVVSWTTRSLSDSGLRYRAAAAEEESISRKELLYGEDYCRRSIVIVEGPLDVWAIGPGAAATLGTGFSRTQIKRILNYPNRIVCMDSEPAAQRRARELASMLECFPGETYCVTLDGKDPASSSRKEIKKLRKHFLD